MVKAPEAANRGRRITDNRPDFDTCKMQFREATIFISDSFKGSVYVTWTWLKDRLNLVFKPDVIPSRQLNESKQKGYVTGSATSIWDEASQDLVGIIREYIPQILDKLPESSCRSCKNHFRVYSNAIPVVSDMWKQFWITKAARLNSLKTEKREYITGIFRDARDKFHYTLSPECYDGETVLGQYKREVFVPELNERIDNIFSKAMTSYVETIINSLPDMVASRCYCSICHKKVEL
jgi:hypothetical protein